MSMHCDNDVHFLLVDTHVHVDGSESTVTVGTPQLQRNQDNTSSGTCSSRSVVSDTPVPVVSSRYQLKVSKMSQMIRRGTAIALKSQEMKLKGKHNPKLHFELKSHASSPEDSSTEYIVLHTTLDVPSNYNRILDTAKFNISVSMTDNSASNALVPESQPQYKEFTLVQENKHMVFHLFPHSFLNSRKTSVDLVIEVQPISYAQPEENAAEYEEKDPTKSVAFVDIQKRTGNIAYIKSCLLFPLLCTCIPNYRVPVQEDCHSKKYSASDKQRRDH